MSDGPEFEYPENTMIGASERLNYYTRQMFRTFGQVTGLTRFIYWILDRTTAGLNWLARRLGR